MKKKILGEMLSEEIQHIYHGYSQYKLHDATFQRWIRIFVHINNENCEQDGLGVTGVTLFIKLEKISENSTDELKKILKSFESKGLLENREYYNPELVAEYYFLPKKQHFLSSKEGQPGLKDEIRLWTDEFLADNGTLKTLLAAVKSKNLDIEGERTSKSRHKSKRNPKEAG